MLQFGAAMFIFLAGCETLDPGPGSVYDEPERQDYRSSDELGPYDVIVYEHVGFEGNTDRYSIAQGGRHALVDFVGWGLNDRISSIRCGSRVGVALFADKEFRGAVAVYDRSTDRVDSDINDWASSLIVFDLDAGGPLGVWIGERGDERHDILNVHFSGKVRFYPLSENIDQRDTEIGRLDDFNDNVEWVILGPIDQRAFRRSNYRDRSTYGSDREGYGYDRRRPLEIEVWLYEHADLRGRSIALPDRYGRDSVFEMSKYDFNRMASSIAMREVESRRRW
jgi:hypothetical protein